MNDVTFEKQNGGLNRRAAGEDHVSGMLFYADTAPDGFDTEVKRVTCVEDVEALGVIEGSADFGIIWYHVSEFFRIAPGAILYVGIFGVPTSVAYAEIITLKNRSLGKIRQYGVFDADPLTTAKVDLLQAMMDQLEVEHAPAVAVLTADISAVDDLVADLDDMRALDDAKVSVTIGQDGGAKGLALFTDLGFTVGIMGATLGAMALAKVNESIMWIEKFNVADVELETPAFGDGTLVADLTVANLDSLNTFGLIFLKKQVDMAGTYFNDSHVACPVDSDYAFIENNRTMDKAMRGVRKSVLPYLGGPLFVDPKSGQIDAGTVKYIEELANKPLEAMASAKELSGYKAYIDPEINVLSTSELQIVIGQVPVGVARQIKIKIGYKLKV